MSSITKRSFADSSGSSAGKKEGGFSGKLLGKMADGLDAIEALAALATKKVNRFMELAAQAAHVARQKLDAAKTIPFANADVEFNASINPARAMTKRQAPSLGLGGGGSSKRPPAKRQKKEEGDE